MKTLKLIKKFYEACVHRDVKNQKKYWLSLLQKSLKHKNTVVK